MEQHSPELQELLDNVDAFAGKMKERLIQKSKEGYTGWKSQYTTDEIQEAIFDRIPRMNDPKDHVEVGIANWAFIHYLIKTKQDG